MGRFLEAVFVFGVVAMVTTASGQDSPGIHGDNEQSPPADACYKVENMGTTSEQLDAGSGPDIRNVPHGAAPAREKTKRMPFRYDPMVTKNVPHGAAPAPEKTKRMPFRYDPMVTEIKSSISGVGLRTQKKIIRQPIQVNYYNHLSYMLGT
ncbi:uncharacterized protein [Ambystoma mexicanum]|uniref:uncharacterized protein isoform X6 n=1 Tax=Ambystoma mexicanum TaxID=8296 RepID=UPI0037E84557